MFGDSARRDHSQTIEEEESEMLHASRKGPEEQNIPAKGLTAEVNILLTRRLLKARQRTNVVSDDYIPEGRLFGAYATRGESIIQCCF